MTNFFGLRAKRFSYLIDDSSEDKKGKDTKKCAIKEILRFKNYQNCLKANQIENKINYLEKKKIP